MEKTKKTGSQLFHSFMWKQMLLSSGLTNAVINGLIYWAITRKTCSNLDYLFSTMLTNAILGILVIILYPIMIKRSLKKNPDLKIPYKREDHLIASLYPKNEIAVRIINLLVGFIITTIITMGLVGCCNLAEVNVAWGAVLRGVDCGVFAIIAYYLCVVFTDNIPSPSKETEVTKQ